MELVGHAADRAGKLAPPRPRGKVTETMGSSDQETAIGHFMLLAWALLLIRRIGTMRASSLVTDYLCLSVWCGMGGGGLMTRTDDWPLWAKDRSR